MKFSIRLAILLPVALMAQCLYAQSDVHPSKAVPDEGVILFASDRSGQFEIYRIKPDGTELAQLTDDPAGCESPSCSPDGKMIAFVSERAGSRSIFTMTADGKARKVADHAGQDGTHISWTPDGKRFLCDLQFELRIDVYIMNADGSEQKELIQEGMWPSWSPDGKTIAFNRGNLPHIYLMDADGGNVRPVRTGGSALPDLCPAWSPDGKTIFFTAVTGVNQKAGGKDMTYEIRSVAADGGNLRTILKTEGIAFCWSPDGTRVLYEAPNRENASREDIDLYVVSLDGTGLTAIAKTPFKEMRGCWCPSASIDRFKARGKPVPAESKATVPKSR